VLIGGGGPSRETSQSTSPIGWILWWEETLWGWHGKKERTSSFPVNIPSRKVKLDGESGPSSVPGGGRRTLHPPLLLKESQIQVWKRNHELARLLFYPIPRKTMEPCFYHPNNSSVHYAQHPPDFSHFHYPYADQQHQLKGNQFHEPQYCWTEDDKSLGSCSQSSTLEDTPGTFPNEQPSDDFRPGGKTLKNWPMTPCGTPTRLSVLSKSGGGGAGRRKGVGGRRKSEKPPSVNILKKRRVAANARWDQTIKVSES